MPDVAQFADTAGLRKQIEDIDRILVGDLTQEADPVRAGELYRQAAAGGSGAAAARAAMLAAVGVGRPADWGEALDLLLLGAELGDRSSRRQLAVIAGRSEERLLSGQASGSALWRRVRAELDIEAALTPPPIQWASAQPRIGVIKGFATPLVAQWLMRRGGEALEPGYVNDALTGEARPHAMRTAMSAAFTVLRRDVVVALMQARAARATGMAVAQHEPPNVISYEPGQQFEEHFDFIEPKSDHFRAELDLLGQRVVTCITYLNDGFEGAETAFPLAGLKLRGAPGDCIVFLNILPDGTPDRRTLHAGLPPKRGRKWILSQWLRDRGQPLV